jgi:hypothetical protein
MQLLSELHRIIEEESANEIKGKLCKSLPLV